MRFEAAIFDLDGTLLDSTGVWDGILAHCLAERGLGCPEDYVAEVCARSFAEAADYTIARFGLDERPERLIEEWNALSLDEYANRVRLLPGALDYLQRLSAQGVRLAVATSLPERLYRPCLERLGIAGMFGALCSTDETGKGKAEPDLFLLAAGRLGVDIGSCAVFDDTLDAVRAVRSAGMLAVAVLSPCSPPGIEDEADVCVRSWTGETGEGEYWELYDENRCGTGLMMRRGDPVPAGLYHICASGWLMDSRGRVLLTQRTADKSFPLAWESTGGCVRFGEDSLSGILRELHEELGLELAAGDARLIRSVRREDDFYDVWLFPAPEPMPQLRLQREEVCGARWATADELLELDRRGELHPLLDYCGEIAALCRGR